LYDVTCYLKLNIVLSENRIQIDYLSKMTELTLRKLIPIAGECLDFLEHLQLYKEKNTEHVFCMKWLKWKSFQYKLGFALIVGVDTSGDLRFGYIQVILLHEDEPLFICSPIINID